MHITKLSEMQRNPINVAQYLRQPVHVTSCVTTPTVLIC